LQVVTNCIGSCMHSRRPRSVIRTVPLEKTPRDGEFGAEGKRFYFTEAGVAAVQVLDPASDKIVAEIPTGASPHFVDLFDGTKLGLVVVQGPGQLLLFDPETNKEVRSIAVGKQPHWAALSGDGKTAYVTNEGSNDVSVVDLGSGKVTAIGVGQGPRKLVVQGSGQARRFCQWRAEGLDREFRVQPRLDHDTPRRKALPGAMMTVHPTRSSSTMA
jgi:YVTN family beta-propeller protein